MKFDYKILNPEQFKFVRGSIAGDNVILITPNDITCKWNADNLNYRSVIVTEDGEPVSLSLKKFFNLNEQPELSKFDKDITKCSLPTKVDGSTLIISRYKGQLITRTRGTIDAYSHENGKEIDILKQKYPNLFDNELLDNGHSIICEWVSPSNRIVVGYDSVDAILINIIRHSDYTYFTQKELDDYAVALGVPRPEMYNFSSLENLCIAVDAFKGIEGICVYYDNDQRIVKIKSAWYLLIHKMKSKLNNHDELVEMFIAANFPPKEEFNEVLKQNSDYELVTMLQPDIDKMYLSYDEYKKFMDALNESLENIRKIPTRKWQALEIKKLFKPEYVSYAFSLLDGKMLDKRKIRDLIVSKM